MLFRTAFRPAANIYNIGLSTSRSFSTTSASLISRRIQPRFNASRTATASLSSTPRHPLLLTTLTLSSGLILPYYLQQPTRNDVGSPAPYSHGRDAKTPLSTDGGRSLNPKAIRQISMGSILGLGLGVVLSALSKMLVLTLGLGIVVWQFAARRGYNIIPVERMQRYVKGVNLRSAINDNAAFKISFGLMFALTAFGEF